MHLFIGMVIGGLLAEFGPWLSAFVYLNLWTLLGVAAILWAAHLLATVWVK